MSRIARPALAVAACVAILSMSACSSSSSTSSEDSTTHSGEAGASAEAPVTNASEIPSDARTNLSNLSVGQCFQQPTDPADGLMIVDCSAPHWGEVYALTPIDAETLPDFEDSTRWPSKRAPPRSRSTSVRPTRSPPWMPPGTSRTRPTGMPASTSSPASPSPWRHPRSPSRSRTPICDVRVVVTRRFGYGWAAAYVSVMAFLYRSVLPLL